MNISHQMLMNKLLKDWNSYQRSTISLLTPTSLQQDNFQDLTHGMKKWSLKLGWTSLDKDRMRHMHSVQYTIKESIFGSLSQYLTTTLRPKSLKLRLSIQILSKKFKDSHFCSLMKTEKTLRIESKCARLFKAKLKLNLDSQTLLTQSALKRSQYY